MIAKIVEIKTEKSIRKYKSQEFIPAGKYIFLQGFGEREKKELPLTYIQSENISFGALTQDESWIREYLGLPPKEKEKTEKKYTFQLRKDIFEKMRTWQKQIIFEFMQAIKNQDTFKIGLIVGLGGGKTLIALLLCQAGESLYIAPKHLKTTILDECEKWGLNYPTEISTPESAKKFAGKKFDVIILDESLSCKNPEAARTKGVISLTRNTPIVLAMTGTPLSAKTALDVRWLRVVGDCISPLEKNIMWKYGINPRYEEIKGVDLGLNQKGDPILPLKVDSYQLDNLAKDLSKNLRIVDISSILKEIPPMEKRRIYFPAPKYYKQIKAGLLTANHTSKRIMQARTCTCGFFYDDEQKPIDLPENPKLDWLKNFITENPEEPIVIFSYWTYEKEKIMLAIADNKPATEENVKDFTDGKTNILVLSSDAAEGLNLQRSRIQIFMSNSTKPVKRTQALGRLYRQGQKRGVIVFDLVCKDTLDEIQIDLLEKYADASEKFIENLLIEELNKSSQ